MKKYIPNTITCCNLTCGGIAVYFAFQADYRSAVAMIVLGAIFDFFDGMSARLLKVSSPIGKELDSLADDITFGLAPAAILFSLLKEMVGKIYFASPASELTVTISHFSFNISHFLLNLLPCTAFLIAAFSALRLAKFNLDERQTTSFIGLPTPANALFWGSLVLGQHDWFLSQSWHIWLILAGILLSCWLLVAELPLFALKFKSLTWRDNWPKYIFLLGSLPCFLLGYTCFAAIIVWYVLLAIVVRKK